MLCSSRSTFVETLKLNSSPTPKKIFFPPIHCSSQTQSEIGWMSYAVYVSVLVCVSQPLGPHNCLSLILELDSGETKGPAFPIQTWLTNQLTDRSVTSCCCSKDAWTLSIPSGIDETWNKAEIKTGILCSSIVSIGLPYLLGSLWYLSVIRQWHVTSVGHSLLSWVLYDGSS